MVIQMVIQMDEETIEQLIERIAIEHHVTLEKEDPILILHTMNKMIVEANKKNQTELLKDLSSNLEVYLLKLSKKSQTQVEIGANAAIRASKDVSVSIIEESIKAIEGKIKTTVEDAIRGNLKQLKKHSRSNRTTAYINLIASFLLLMGCSIFFFTFYLQS